jgi:hypothetical protein
MQHDIWVVDFSMFEKAKLSGLFFVGIAQVIVAISM